MKSIIGFDNTKDLEETLGKNPIVVGKGDISLDPKTISAWLDGDHQISNSAKVGCDYKEFPDAEAGLLRDRLTEKSPSGLYSITFYKKASQSSSDKV